MANKSSFALNVSAGLLVVFLSSITLVGCNSSAPTQAVNQGRQVIRIDGSSTVYPISLETAQEYQLLSASNPQIDVKFSGTTAGFNMFCQNTIEIGSASRPILKSEQNTCKSNNVSYLELPIAFDALTVVVNPQNTWANDITLEELRRLWEPKATNRILRWNQIRASWPDRPIRLYGPGEQSGTFDYFTQAVMGKAGSSRRDYVATEDDTLTVRGVSSNPDALGYLGFAYFEENSRILKPLAIQNGSVAVLPSKASVIEGRYQPFARPLFIYVNANQAKSDTQLREFISYYLGNAREFSRTVGYIPLTDELYSKIMNRFERNQVGSVFGGRIVIDETLERLLDQEK